MEINGYAEGYLKAHIPKEQEAKKINCRRKDEMVIVCFDHKELINLRYVEDMGMVEYFSCKHVQCEDVRMIPFIRMLDNYDNGFPPSEFDDITYAKVER